jgi:UDP-N-acetylbacillosamine N-acetyltransferase
MAKRPLLIWGAGGHARVIHDIVLLLEIYEPVGFIDDVDPARWGHEFLGCPILGGAAAVAEVRRRGVQHAFVAIGDNQGRVATCERMVDAGFELPALIHPGAIVARTATVAAGTVVAAGAVIGPDCRIGPNCLINTSSSVDHESRLEEGVHVSPGAHLAGRTHIGRLTWIGIGASVVDRVTIGTECTIGAGSVVLEDIPPRSVAVGVPARVVKSI